MKISYGHERDTNLLKNSEYLTTQKSGNCASQNQAAQKCNGTLQTEPLLIDKAYIMDQSLINIIGECQNAKAVDDPNMRERVLAEHEATKEGIAKGLQITIDPFMLDETGNIIRNSVAQKVITPEERYYNSFVSTFAFPITKPELREFGGNLAAALASRYAQQRRSIADASDDLKGVMYQALDKAYEERCCSLIEEKGIEPDTAKDSASQFVNAFRKAFDKSNMFEPSYQTALKLLQGLLPSLVKAMPENPYKLVFA